MNCKKRIGRIAAVIVLLVMVVNFVFVYGAKNVEAETDEKINKYNVVFVTDSSGSMNETDPKKYRFDAIDLFVGLVSNGGNNVGSVVFSDSIKTEYPLTEMRNKNDKTSMSSEIKKVDAEGWTNIGCALKKSVSMLEASGDQSMQSLIILLTDGNTEMSTKELKDISIQEKEDAVETAREKGYKIYTICLNKDNSANVSELAQIASATGGEFKEVNQAEDLQSVFDMYYQLIYGTKSQKIVDQTMPESGVINNQFNVADVGVEEVNVVLFGEVNSTTLSSPAGKTFSNNEIEDMSYGTNSFKIIKIEEPLTGVWNLGVGAQKGSVIKVFKIYNPNLIVKATTESSSDDCKVGEKVEILAELYEGGTKIQDINRYKGYKAKLTVKDFDGNTVFETEKSEAEGQGFCLDFVPDNYGTYYATISVESDELYAEAETLTFNVGNTPPIVNEKVLSKSIWVWPFLLKTDPTIDLSQAASDAEDKTLSYRVESSTWMDDGYSVDGSKLSITDLSIGKGSFKVRAYDTQGAYCTFDVKANIVNVGLIALIGIIIGAVILLIVLFILYRIAIGKCFMGTVTVSNIMTGKDNSIKKNRGRIYVKNMNVGVTGINPKAYVQATGKDYVYFISGKPFTSDSAPGKVKKIKIEHGLDEKIYTDNDKTEGISIGFSSVKRKY